VIEGQYSNLSVGGVTSLTSLKLCGHWSLSSTATEQFQYSEYSSVPRIQLTVFWVLIIENGGPGGSSLRSSRITRADPRASYEAQQNILFCCPSPSAVRAWRRSPLRLQLPPGAQIRKRKRATHFVSDPFSFFKWWTRWELNPRPKAVHRQNLHV
jgi:hypothetical protein